MFTSRTIIKAIAEYEEKPSGRVVYRISYCDPVRLAGKEHHCLGYIFDGEILKWFGYSKENLPPRLELTITVDAIEAVEIANQLKKA